ncbi:MAG: aspartate--tRNA(Asn) ligase [Bacillota bacterium]|nr:aspartate--tRNA(Asn) ligase [Bacillota bacterium]
MTTGYAGRTLAGYVAAEAGRYVELAGWTHRVRRIGGITFLLIRDRTGMAQVVFEAGGPDEVKLERLGAEDVVRVGGMVRADARAPGGAEVLGRSLDVISAAEPPPFEINLPAVKAGLDLILDHRVISLRHPTAQAVFRIKADIVAGFRRFSEAQGMVEVQTPKIVATGTEGGANLFAVDYVGRRAYLAQSPQFYKQLLVMSGFERVFEVGPVYRAEPHNTSRHLNEFTSMDWEIGFVGGAGEVMDLEEEMLSGLVASLSEIRGRELSLVGADVRARLPAGGIPRLALAAAVALLERSFGKVSPRGDLDPEGERLLCEATGGAVFVTEWPAATRPAYAAPLDRDPELTDSFDLLLGGMEVTTGGRRISDYAQLRASLAQRGLDPGAFGFYLDGFRYGTPPHAGLAIGLERLTMALLGLGNMREVTLFPRDLTRLEP